VTVSGPGSIWTNTGTIQIGGLGTGTLTIQSGGTVNSGGGGSVGLSAGSTGTVVVTGPGSVWNNTPGGGLNIGAFGTGMLTIANGGVVNNNTAFIANIGSSAGSQGTVIVTGAGSTWTNRSGLNVGGSGRGTLTVSDSGIVNGPITIAANAGSVGTLNIGGRAGDPPVAPGALSTATVAFGSGTGMLTFNHSSANYVFAPAISGNGAVNVLAGTTILTAANTYTGVTTIAGGTFAAGAVNTFSAASHTVVESGGTLALRGFNQTLNNGLENAGTVQLGIPGVTPPGTTLTVAGNYVGHGGTLALNTFLGGDGSPTDQLIINGGSADPSLVRITHVGGGGGYTTNGIPVVVVTNGGTTTPNAFSLANTELRAGFFDYRLFRGGVDGSRPDDWFLRSDFLGNGGNGGGDISPPGELPTDPAPIDPPAGIWPIIGPELATYGVVQPIARQMGLFALGTLHERIGDTAADAACLHGPPGGVSTAAAPSVSDENCRPPVWGRLFGQQIDNRYRAFADPRASGRLLGIQAGIDLWRGSLIRDHSDFAGLYFAYGNGYVSVDGLVTNEAATGYMLEHTGSVNLNAYSIGGYWTHYGPAGWYTDLVLQGSFYSGNASTQFANLPIQGSGFTASLEAGYPFPLPAFGPGFVLEPQAQIIWQEVSFADSDDGLGTIALGSTSGPSGRLGLRGRWKFSDAAGRVWQPYVRANVWHDWGAQATTMFESTAVPLIEEATRLEFAGGLSAKLLPNLSFYAQAGYQFGTSGQQRRDGIKGDFGLHYSW
jgi:outer membrane autotransporter protein